MKNWVKVATSYGVTMGGFKIRIGSIYGENSGKLFVCADYSSIDSGILHVHVSVNNGKWWERTTIKADTRIFRAITEKIAELGRVPAIGTFRDVEAKNWKIPLPSERKVNYQFTPMKDTRYQLSKHNGDNCDFGGRMINPQLITAPKNHMKVDQKKLPKPIWERPTNIPKDIHVKTFQTEGSLHELGEEFSVSNVGICYDDPNRKNKKNRKNRKSRKTNA